MEASMTLNKIDELIVLTNKKNEALSYMKQQLNESEVDIEQYFSNKSKVEKALLKVDMEFLNVYNALLTSLNLNAIGELSKEKYPNLKKLQESINEIKLLEKEIQNIEQSMITQTQASAKHQAPRAIEAYNKNKK